MGVCNTLRLAVLIVQSLLLSHSFTPKLNKPRFQQTSTSKHIRESLTWFQDNADKFINRDQSFETYQPTVESLSQSQPKRTNIFSKIFSVFRKNIAILSIVFLLPTASFARSSSAKKSSNESPKSTSELVKVLKKKGSKSSVRVIEKSQKAKQSSQQQLIESDDDANDDEIFQQRLKYIGIGLTAASILATLLSGDDKPSSSSSSKTGKKSSLSSSRDNTSSNNNNNNSRSILSSNTLYKPSATSSITASSPPLSSIKKTMVPKRPISSTTPTSAKTSTTPQSTTNTPPSPMTRKTAATSNEEEEDDDLFSDADVDSIKPLPPITTSKSATTSSTPPSTRIRTPLNRTPLSTNTKAIVTPPQPTPISPPVAVITPSPPSPPVTVVTPPVPPAPPAKKQGGGGILSRIFQKPGGNRDPSLTQVLKPQDSATEFRIVTANLLAQLLPTPSSSSSSVLAKDGLFPDLSADGGRLYDPRVEAIAAARETAFAQAAASKPLVTATSTTTTDADGNVTTETTTAAVEDHSNDAAANLLEYIASESSLSPSQAAEAFAEVTSAMLVTLIDEAVVLYEQKEKEKDKNKSESYDENILLALDSVTDFVAQAGSLYAKNYVSIAIDPVQYNGKSKRNSVESLYLLYFKSSAQWQMKQVFESMNQSQKLQQQQEEESAAAALSSVTGGSSTETKSNSESKQETEVEEEKIPTAEDVRESQRVDKAGLLQRALGIKEGKRNSLEQKAQKDIMMNMSGGMGFPSGGGGLGDMFQSIKGAAGGGMPDMSAINNMMGGGGGGFPGGMPGADSADNPFKDMSQEEMMEMTKQSIVELKNMLAEGNVTKDMVIEMEKGMGIDFNAFVKMMDLPGAKENLKKVGPEMVEMMGMFKQLVQIKKAG